MSCINIRSKDFIQLMEETNLPSIVLEFKINKWQSDNNTDNFPNKSDIITESEINFSFKSIDILSSDKAIKAFDKGNKNGWDLNKILTELQIPKDQKQLILDKNTEDREEIITSLLADNSFVVEVNTATKNDIGIKETFDPETEQLDVDYIEPDIDYEEEYDNEGNIIGMKPVLSEKGKKQLEEKPTQYYSNLTVPGGTNYTENEISTPLITPSIKGHAQFATDNGIGWHRSDDRVIDIQQMLKSSLIKEVPCK